MNTNISREAKLQSALNGAYRMLGKIFHERDKAFKPISMNTDFSMPDSIDLVLISRDEYDRLRRLESVIDEVRSEL